MARRKTVRQAIEALKAEHGDAIKIEVLREDGWSDSNLILESEYDEYRVNEVRDFGNGLFAIIAS